LVAGITSHPDINDAGALSFYAGLKPAGSGAYLFEQRRLVALADTGMLFKNIGPLGPTMNQHGAVAFRADLPTGASGIFSSSRARSPPSPRPVISLPASTASR